MTIPLWPPVVAARLMAVASILAILAACGGSMTGVDTSPSPRTTPGGTDTSPSTRPTAASDSGLFDPSAVHELSLSFDEAAYDAMLAEYRSTGAKEWMEATVTVDGTSYERAGIRLKGNSSLGGLRGGGLILDPGGLGGPAGSPANGEFHEVGSPGGPGDASPDDPGSLPWLVDLDRFVDGQSHLGVAEFVVRSNPSATALNEAVALELLERAGLASQHAVAVRFSVNGEEERLRLVIEHPDDPWMSERFAATGALYKAESTGDYSYRGDDPDAYDEVFEQEAGSDNADLAPLIEFLDFIENADDATFAAEIAEHFDVDAFATYLAMQDLLGNFDDIDGPGNNSYLYYDTATGRFTVVPWDHNLAFGGLRIVGGPGDVPPGGDGSIRRPPAGLEPLPSGDIVIAPGDGPPGPLPSGAIGGPKRANPLVERLLENEEFAALVTDRTAELKAELFDSGVGSAILDGWAALLETQASDLVDAETIASEAADIAAHLSGAGDEDGVGR